MTERVKSWFRRQEVDPPTWDDHGISCTFKGQRVQLPWNEVVTVFAWNKDCWSVDQRRVTVIGPVWCVDWTEDDPSFYFFCHVLSTHLSVRPDWLEEFWDLPPFSRERVKV